MKEGSRGIKLPPIVAEDAPNSAADLPRPAPHAVSRVRRQPHADVELPVVAIHYTDLLERIDELIEANRAMRGRLLPQGLESAAPALMREAESLVEAGLALVEETARRAEGRAEETGEGIELEIADLAWLGRQEVASRLDQARRAPSGDEAWRRLAVLDAALDRSDRLLVAVEERLLARLGRDGTDRSRAWLEEALEVRRVYAALHRSLRAVAEPPAGEELRDELWLIGTELEAIRRRRTEALLRLDDRRALRTLQGRIAAALEVPDAAGERVRNALWQELLTFSELLMAVNDREELRRHDREVLARLERRLELEPPRERPGRRELASLIGRDPELDRLVLEPDDPSTEVLRPVVERLLAELAVR